MRCMLASPLLVVGHRHHPVPCHRRRNAPTATVAGEARADLSLHCQHLLRPPPLTHQSAPPTRSRRIPLGRRLIRSLKSPPPPKDHGRNAPDLQRGRLDPCPEDPPLTGAQTTAGATPARSQGSHQPATAPSVGSAAGTGGSAARVAGTAPGGPPAGWSTRRHRVNASPPRPRLRDTGGRASEGRGGGGTRRSAAAGDLGGGDLEVVGVGGEKEGREEKKGG
jgi:hypothetical protein